MNAVVLRQLGDADNLRLEVIDDPKAGPGEVVVRLRAAALNHRDVWIRRGLYAGIKLPLVLGSDGAGVIEEIGEGVDPSFLGRAVVIDPGLDWGDDPRAQGPAFRILGLPDFGTYAERVKVSAAYVHAWPEGLSAEEAAAIPLAGLTAYRAVVTRGAVQPGETVLVTGIGGGVSAAALQIARALGARVFVTSGSDIKLEKARGMGAAGGVNYRAADWPRQLTTLTDDGPDVVIDSIGGETLNKLIEVVKPGGRIVTYGATTGPAENVEIRRIFWKQINLLGSTMGTPSEFAAMIDLYRQHGLKPVVDRAFPLAEAAEAHRRMEQAEQFGKILLSISP